MTTIDGSDIIEILDEFTQEGLTAFHQNQVLLSALESRDEDLVRNQSLVRRSGKIRRRMTAELRRQVDEVDAKKRRLENSCHR